MVVLVFGLLVVHGPRFVDDAALEREAAAEEVDGEHEVDCFLGDARLQEVDVVLHQAFGLVNVVGSLGDKRLGRLDYKKARYISQGSIRLKTCEEEIEMSSL